MRTESDKQFVNLCHLTTRNNTGEMLIRKKCIIDLQCCAKVMQANFSEIPGISWFFEEIFRKFPCIFVMPIVLVNANFRTIICGA